MSFTDYHPESWQPAWTISNILHGIVSYMPVDEEETLAVGALKASAKERHRIAKVSRNYICKTCAQTNRELLREHLLAQPGPAENEKQEDGSTTAKASPAAADIEKKLAAKLENGMTLGEIAQLFMLEPDMEKQDQMMKGNTFKLPAAEEGAGKAQKKDQNKKEKESEREVDEEESSGPGSEQDEEAASNGSVKLLDEIEDFIDESLLKKMNKNKVDMEI